ncbi:MAG: hypothetical protein LKJ90_04770 [Faecalibacterium sp.]|jgi:hypothetical protein|nr:hypothetical protein [Faecalibacterium sp.]
MKQLWKKAGQHPTAAFYALGAAGLILWMLASFCWDTVCYATGRIREQTITLDDTSLYALANMAWQGDTLTAETGDAQLILQPGQRIRTLRLVAQYQTPGTNEMDLYYHLPGGGYSAQLRVWPTLAADGASWEYRLPLITGQNIRLDLADQSGVTVRVEKLVCNERRAWYTYFVPSLWQLLWLAAVPGLAGCLLALLRDAAHTKFGPRKGNAA